MILDAYERHRTQLRFVNSIYEVASVVARMHRAIAKMALQVDERSKLVFETEKGVKEVPISTFNILTTDLNLFVLNSIEFCTNYIKSLTEGLAFNFVI